MSQRNNIKWLYNEIPSLISNGIISDENAQKIRDYYGETDEKNWLKVALAIFGTLGAILIGTGIILLLARNWQELSRSTRTVISLLPLLFGQTLSGWVIFSRKESDAWREGAASFLMLAIGSSIALIGQTYHIPGDFSSFMFTWMVLSFPLVYLLNAGVPAILFMVGITIWAGGSQAQGGYAIAFWPLLALIAPFIYKSIKKDSSSNRSTFLMWGLTIVLCVSIGISLEKVLPGLWVVVYSSYFAILSLVDRIYFDEDYEMWQYPFRVVGNAGILVLAFIGSYKQPWRDIGWNNYRTEYNFHAFAGIVDYVLVAILLFAAIYFIYRLIISMSRPVDFYSKGNKVISSLLAILPILALLSFIWISLTSDTSVIVVIYNVYLLTLGIAIIIEGINKRLMSTTNAGMLIVSLLIIMRFFDMDLGFTIRGIAFIIIGSGFLVSNLMLLKMKKEEVAQQ